MSEETPQEAPAGQDELATLRDEVARLRESGAASRARLVRAELKAEAVRAGLIDLDALGMVAPEAVTLDEGGEVVGAAAAMAALRRDKPYLFGLPSSSSAASPPPSRPTRARLATEMGYEEWRLARLELLRRR